MFITAVPITKLFARGGGEGVDQNVFVRQQKPEIGDSVAVPGFEIPANGDVVLHLFQGRQRRMYRRLGPLLF